MNLAGVARRADTPGVAVSPPESQTPSHRSRYDGNARTGRYFPAAVDVDSTEHGTKASEVANGS
jgi:hypothetical protein